MTKCGIKKAQKSGYKSDYYLAFNLSYAAAMDVLAGAKLSRQVKPEITCTINFLDKAGKKVSQVIGETKATNSIRSERLSW